jgi:hypothetical protein
MIISELRVRVPVELLDYKSLISVGLRLLAACESIPNLRREGETIVQTRIKLSGGDLAIVQALSTRPGWSDARVIWAGLVMAARSRLNPDEPDRAPGRRAEDRLHQH